jgi:hypothetical protein
MFIKNCIIDRYTDKNKNRQCITSGIKHWGLSGYSSVLPRIKFGVTGQVCSPQSPTISYRRPLATMSSSWGFNSRGLGKAGKKHRHFFLRLTGCPYSHPLKLSIRK